MRKLVLLCASLCAMMLAGPAGPAHAQSILWVANYGSDSNNCAETSPCATFAGAIQKGGVAQINCLSSGNYGVLNATTVSISGSITIDCGTGNVGNIFSSGTAIAIDASSAVTVVLRHLSLNGLGTAANGISTPGFPGGSLTVEDCTIQNNTGAGIAFEPNNGRGMLQVSNSQVINNGFGITVQPVNGQIASVTLNRVEVAGNAADGLSLIGPGVVAGTMRDSLVVSNGADGVQTTANQVFFTVEESSIVDNLQAGIHTLSAGSVVNVAASTIGGNGTGVLASSGSLISFGDNHMSANGSNGNFTSTTALR